MRSFIAIELPEEIKSEIFHKFEDIQESGLVIGNFSEKDKFHLTLKFIGDISEEQLEKIQKKLSEIKFNKFETSIGKIGFFPDKDYVRVIWVELVSEELLELQKIIENKLNEIGISKDEKEFTSHITIVRVKKIKDKSLFSEKIKKINIKKTSFRVDNFYLMKSELKRNGPVYKTLEKFPLK